MFSCIDKCLGRAQLPVDYTSLELQRLQKTDATMIYAPDEDDFVELDNLLRHYYQVQGEPVIPQLLLYVRHDGKQSLAVRVS